MDDALYRQYLSPSIREHRVAVRALQERQQERLGKPRSARVSSASVRADNSIPGLAWICHIKNGSFDFTVGTGVETAADFIFEGVWDGDFQNRSIHTTDYAYGSGAVFRKHAIFVPPKHCYESLYVIHRRRDNDTLVSNSMVYAFSAAGLQVPGSAFNEIARVLRDKNDEATSAGYDIYDPLIYQDDDYCFYSMMFYNFSVNGEGQFRLLPSMPSRLFSGYGPYRNFLKDKVDALAKNGADPLRRHTLSPLTLMSNGYDSPCVGALASELGYKDAATISVVVKGRDDSGKDIAERLGMSVDEVRHVLGDDIPELAVALKRKDLNSHSEFIATAGLGDDVMLKPLERHLENRIYLSGALGDSAWRRACTLPPGLPVRVSYGKSITEFRLRVGFAFVPVPVIGARFVWPIKRMTKSAEMAAYTLKRPYDRPFPRRVVEEAGIERGTFANAKAATNPTIMNQSLLFEPSVIRILKRYKDKKGLLQRLRDR